MLLSAIAAATPALAAKMTLSWADNSTNETGFSIERATGSTGAFSVVGTTGANVATYVDDGLPGGTLFRYRVRAFNAAGYSGYTNTASGTTPADSANTAPTVSTIANRTISEDGTTGAIGFTVADAQSGTSGLTLTGSSSNTTLVPTSGITFGGSGANRTVTVRPAANRSGTATITVRVSDGSLSTSRTFTVTVTAVNDAPTISDIANRTVSAGGSSGAIAFTIGDAETSTSSLAVSATSSNQTLLPSSRITLGGSGSSRTISVSPASGQSGSVTVTVRVSDGSASTSDTFVVTVGTSSSTGNTAPTITSISNQNLALNGTTGALAFTIRDAQTAASSLKLVVNASNKSLVPLSNITLGGSGEKRTITVRPLSNTTGWSTIWVKVSDGTLSKTISFVVNVSAKLAFADIGAPARTGSQTISGTTIDLKAGGKDIWGGSDQFRYGSLSLEGDSELTVRLASMTNTHAWAKAGIMYRASSRADAAYVFLCLTPSSGLALQYRSTTGAAAAQKDVTSVKAPRWLKLTRAGDVFYAFHSADGKSWQLLDSVKVDLPTTTLAGLAATSHNDASITTVRFESLSVD